jgi:hypothetical protein
MNCKPCANISISISKFALAITACSVHNDKGKDKVRPRKGHEEPEGE